MHTNLPYPVSYFKSPMQKAVFEHGPPNKQCKKKTILIIMKMITSAGGQGLWSKSLRQTDLFFMDWDDKKIMQKKKHCKCE